MFKFIICLCIVALIVFLAIDPQLQAQEQQTQHTEHEEYSESALRRFEIVTLSSLPFTAVHSYLGVRAVRMVQTNKIAPVLTPQHYRVMGISAVSLSLFIGIWDWLHTRNVDRSAPSVPGRKPPTPPSEEEVPPDGTIAGLSGQNPYLNLVSTSIHLRKPHELIANSQLNMWAADPPIGLVIPLIQIRF